MEQEQIETHKTTMGSESGSFNVEILLKEFSIGVYKCAGGVHKTSISSMNEKAVDGVLFGMASVLAGGPFQVSAYGRIPLHGLDDHYFGLRFGEIYGDDECVHGDIEASIVVDIDDGACTSATLITKDDDGSVLMESKLDEESFTVAGVREVDKPLLTYLGRALHKYASEHNRSSVYVRRNVFA